MAEWKHRHPQHVFPAHLTRHSHDRHSRAGTLLAVMIVCTVAGLWGGYTLGWERRSDELAASEPPRITACPQSTADADIIEHAWTHQGVLIHRECLVIRKPVFASPRYSTASPNL